MTAQAEKQTNFNSMIGQLPDLSAEIVAEISSSDRFEFVFNQCVSSPGFIEHFQQETKLEVESQDYYHGDKSKLKPGQPICFKRVALDPNQVVALITFIYKTIYLNVREDMIKMENEVAAEMATEFDSTPVGKA